MKTDLVLELQKVGLDEREARVYLACLELGPSPVQKIAQRADVARATTYLVLDDLQNKGFVTTYDEGKKTFFVAESPERLAAIIDDREAVVKRQKETLKKLVPELLSRGQFEKSQRPVIRYYEGAEAMRACIRDNLAGQGGEVLNILHFERAAGVLAQINLPIEKVRERRKRQHINSRVIYTSDKGPMKDYSTAGRNVKYVPIDKYPFEADIVVRGSRVFLAPYNAPMRAVAIEDEAIASTVKMVFEALWAQLD